MRRQRLFHGEQLEARIERYQAREAHRNLAAQLAQMQREGPTSAEVRRFLCIVPMARCANGAVRAGVPRLRVMQVYWKRVAQLVKLRSWPATTRHLHRFADEMLDLVRPERRTNIERLITRIRGDIRERVDSPSTLKEYADAAGVSREYLSRCFVQIAGRTFREELREARIGAACRLLRETSLKVGVIAHHVGLRDASQFVADFRRQTGVTPAAFRRNHQDRE